MTEFDRIASYFRENAQQELANGREIRKMMTQTHHCVVDLERIRT